MKRVYFVALFISIFFGNLLLGAPAHATRVYIDIDQPFAKKFPVAIPDFMPIAGGTGGPADMTVGLPGRLGKNLDMTGMFINLDKRTFLESNRRAGLSGAAKVKYEEWQAIGAEFLVKGAFTLAGDQLTLELRLFDVFSNEMILGKRYSGHKKDARKMINRFTNEILFLITGEPGVFGTKIAFVSGTRANKSVMMAEFGSDEVTGVAGSRGGPSTQPAMSDSNSVAYIHRNGKVWELRLGGQVISAGPLHLSPVFTPGGALVAAISGKFETNIFRFPGPGAKPIPITKHWGINISPTFSPDGAQMAFVSNRSGGAQIYVSGANGGGARRLTTSGKENTDPNWSPRGDRIVFCGNSSDIFTIAPDGSDLQQLTSGQGRNTRPTWSPDGRLIVFTSTRFGRSQLFIMTANGERQQPLMPDYRGDQRNSYWSPAKPDFSGNAGK